MAHRIEIYIGSRSYPGDRWFWRLRATNGRVIADGAEGYQTRAGVTRAVTRFTSLIGPTEVVVIAGPRKQ